MSVYALLLNAAYRGRLTVEDVELEGALDGNLCRCTGYKPILDAAKTFVGEYMKGGVYGFSFSFLLHVFGA
jgi:xanthine dehydrogenase/oxidase